jgi:hypothetical protein
VKGEIATPWVRCSKYVIDLLPGWTGAMRVVGVSSLDRWASIGLSRSG